MRKTRLLIVAAFCLATLPLAPATAGSSPEGRYIVVLRDDANPHEKSREHETRYGVKADRHFRSALKGYAADVPESRVEQLRNDPSVVMVARNRVFRAAAQTTPTGVRRVDADVVSGTGDGVQVAVLDSGIDLDHPDLAGNVVGGADCDGSDTGNYNDQNGHGTHVAGTIAAIDNAEGVRGVAPEVDLWAVRILNAQGSGDDVSILCGLDFVASHPAIRVANMSIEAVFPSTIDDENCGLTNNDPVHFAICVLDDDGVTVVAAAGNGDPPGNAIDMRRVAPAAYDEVITVTALNDLDGAPCGAGGAGDDRFASFSNYAVLTKDRAHTIAAPGTGIFSTVRGGAYGFSDGTSMASPHVAGAAARYVQTHPAATRIEILAALQAASEPKDVDFKGECGGGSSHTDPSGLHPERVLRLANWVIPIQAATPGVVRGNIWFLNNGFDAIGDVTLAYGRSTDRVVVGDWNDDGVDTPGIVRGNVWYLNDGFDGANDVPVFAYGRSTDRVVVGDWDDDGVDTPGIVRGNVWYLNDGFDGANDVPVFGYGRSSDRIVVGDWNGDGRDTPGVVRGNVWFLNEGFDPAAEISLSFGKASDEPLVGDWDGDGDDDLGVRRGNIWYLRIPTGSSVVVVSFAYARSTDRAVVGDWDGIGTP